MARPIKFDGSNSGGTPEVTAVDGTELVRVRLASGQEVLVALSVIKAYING